MVLVVIEFETMEYVLVSGRFYATSMTRDHEAWVSAAFHTPSPHSLPRLFTVLVRAGACWSATVLSVLHSLPTRLRTQEFDVGFIHHVFLTAACSPMAVLCSVLIASARLCSQLRLRRPSGQQDRPAPSGLHPCLERGPQRLAIPSFGGHLHRKRAAHIQEFDGGLILHMCLTPRSFAALAISLVNAFKSLFFQEDETSPTWFHSLKISQGVPRVGDERESI